MARMIYIIQGQEEGGGETRVDCWMCGKLVDERVGGRSGSDAVGFPNSVCGRTKLEPHTLRVDVSSPQLLPLTCPWSHSSKPREFCASAAYSGKTA